MGKKVKVGKYRKDKFYQLAKESGYRSRAAFKLLQLNREYKFLEKSRVCIDLCAAPGGWLQVAATNMPMSSVIIGIDLAPIKSIANVITHVEDITTPKCRLLLKQDLVDNKADVVLHDGAPNVGKNWLHDAYQQNMLVLQSFKLASEFLRKGGWFITKVFRSKDYNALLWVFQQFFKKVQSTKPAASRNESAEIFIVCQNYIAPDHIDQKFFDIGYVFNDVHIDQQQQLKLTNKSVILNQFKQDLGRRHRDGYADNDYTLYHRLNVTEFIVNPGYMQLLAQSNEIVLNNDAIASHEDTTFEIKECLKDIRILGIQEVKALLKWRSKMKDLFGKDLKSEWPVSDESKEDKGSDDSDSDEDGDDGEEKEDDDDDGDKAINDEIERNLEAERKVEKKKRKKLMKEKRKLRDKLALKMELPNDTFDFHLQGDNAIFSLEKIKTKKQLVELQTALPGLELSDNDNDDDSDIDIESGLSNKRKRKALYGKDDKDDLDKFYEQIENPNEDEEGGDGDDEDLGLDEKDDVEDDGVLLNEVIGGEDDEDEEANPLITDLTTVNKEAKRKLQASTWFKKAAFECLENEDDDLELLGDLDSLEKAKTQKKPKQKNGGKKARNGEGDDDDDSIGDESHSETSDDDVADIQNFKKRKADKMANGHDNDEDDAKEKSKIEIVPQKQIKLSSYELALGELMVNSKKKKAELIDDSYHRWTGFGDDEDQLPKWFVDDEKQHCRKELDVPQEVKQKYEQKNNDAINVRPIKKVVEAQARKKRRMNKKLDKARKKAENVTENVDMSDKERSKELKQIYKRAGLLKKKKVEVKYVVSKRGSGGKRPQGVKGPYKIVDKRLKKDKKFAKDMARKNKGGGKKRGGGGGSSVGKQSGGKSRSGGSGDKQRSGGGGKGKGGKGGKRKS